MTGDLRTARATAIAHLDRLIARGRHIADAMDAADAPPGVEAWQQDCAAAIAELSGGSKAHWLSREFSAALLVRSPDGSAMVEAGRAEIVRRLLDVLAQARTSLTLSIDDVSAAADAAAPRRFEFVHRRALRPVLERAFAESRAALERREFERALVLCSGIIEALVTDAIEHELALRRGRGDADLPSSDAVADLSFDERVAAAQRLGLIRNSCARLPASARRCRELSDSDGALAADIVVTERDARVASQVLHVVVRDLDPGR